MSAATPESVLALAVRLLDEACTTTSGRSAHRPVGGSGHALRQAVIALCAGEQLAEHANPGEATVLVISGSVELRAGDDVTPGCEGELLPIPPRAHSRRVLIERRSLARREACVHQHTPGRSGSSTR